MKITIAGDTYPGIPNFMFDNSLVFERIVWLAGQVMAQSEDFENLLSDITEREAESALGIKASKLDGAEPDEVIEMLIDKDRLGFLVDVSTPIPQRFHGSKDSFSSSLGYRQHKVFYTEDLKSPEFLGELAAWRQSIIDRVFQKQHPELVAAGK